ncbi:aminotransferase yhxA [Niallia sp. 01092]|uniref:aminotransferase yhxA n=1 Tax=unclassified Niallia TaxID=2837522 RepID=UPI003FD1BEE9
MGKTTKVMTGIISTAFMLNLAACNNQTDEEYTTTQKNPDPPSDANCDKWEWDDDDGVWECEDRHSSHYGHYFYGGSYYNSRSALHNSKYYKSPTSSSKNSSVNSRNSTNSSSVDSGSSSETSKSVKRSSGFGSGSKSYGG